MTKDELRAFYNDAADALSNDPAMAQAQTLLRQLATQV
jgi:hypothetical protein